VLPEPQPISWGRIFQGSGPAIADEDCDFRERGDRDNAVVCRDEDGREVFEVDDFYYDDEDFFDDEDYYFYYRPFLYVEEIDVDCDEIDDSFDGWIDEGAVCEVEFEFEEVFAERATFWVLVSN